MEINGDEETLMKNQSPFYLKSTEKDHHLARAENTDNALTGKQWRPNWQQIPQENRG